MAIVTFESVAEAAESLVAAGERASVRSIIKRLGGGSPNTVLQYVNEWKSGRVVVRITDMDLSPRITAAIVEQMKSVAGEAASAAEERAAAAEDNLQTMAEANQIAEQQIAALTAEKAGFEARVVTLDASLRDQHEAFTHKLETAQAKIDELASDLEKERVRATSASVELGKSQVKLDAIPVLEKQIEDQKQQIAKLQGDLEAQRKTHSVAEQRTAVVEAQMILVVEQASKAAADLIKAETKHADEHKQLRAELDDARHQIKDAVAEARVARDQAAELRGQLAAAKAAHTPSPINQTEGSSNA